MKFYVKLLAIVLVLVTFSTQVASCAFPSFNIGTTDKNTSTDNVVVIPPNSGENGENSGNHVGGAVVENVTAPYIADVYVSAPVEPDESNRVPEGGVNLDSSLANAIVPGGVKLEDGSNEVALTINGIEDSKANVELLESEVSSSFDVHVSGVALDNIVPMEVKLTAAAVKGLNSTSIKLYHVENGETIEMTLIPNDAEFTAHNQFKYDPATGDVTLYIASFSEFAIVANTDNAWKGGVDHSWYKADATELVIANAEQLWSLSQIVGGMAKGIEQDSFSGKTIKLIADINLGDKESENDPDIIFYPIGYYNSEGTYERTNTAITSGLRNFEGTFDGNGHTIANFYQNTWEMKGDHNWYSPEEQYYRDGMGLFGRVYGGTVKNLTVENFSSDGEIATTGVIAAYADGATFQNISIFNCNPRVYNIGNGGIVGCVGWYAKEAGLKTYFTNITVDNTNKISALWGSYDVACGGILGQYYPTSGQSSYNYPVNAGIEFTNCHVSAVMDVYNDVCANYQYYAYRYTGMLIGSVRENETIDGRVYPKMDDIVANGCTVHFGTWNDYYYCELVANTTASYTHDHQMSRLEQVLSVEGTTITPLKGEPFTVPAEGRYNYVVVTGEHASENATCYHFVDGAVWNHEDAGYHNGENGEKFIDENGDGEPDLKEDKQHIYLEFNNLFTGYGWGVTSVGLDTYENVNVKDKLANIGIGPGEAEGSTEKFDYIYTGNEGKLEIGKEYTLGELFAATGLGEAIKNSNVVVTVSPSSADTKVDYLYTMNTENWTQSTLKISTPGDVTITITDYYYCKSTSITVNVDKAHKFEYLYGKERNGETNLNHKDFLLRVGNANAVSLNLLFGEIENCYLVDLSTLNVTVTNGTFTKGNTWDSSTINFAGYTGIATITIEDGTSYPCSIPVEVVNATNATSATGATSNNVVLLSNCNFSSLDVSGGFTFYGNGFKMTCSNDSYATDRNYSFVTLENGTLDNVQVIVPNFSHAILYDSNKTDDGNSSYTDSSGKTRYYNIRSAVLMTGNSKITNSYVSGGRVAVYVTNGNNIIDNSTIVGGAAANIQVEATAKLKMKDIVLIQKPTTATVHDTSKTIMGLSVILMCDTTGIGAPVTLEGTIRQYAWANEDYKIYVPSEAQTFVTKALEQTDYVHNIEYDDGVTRESINLGILYMPSGTTASKIDGLSDNRSTSEKNDVPYGAVQINGLAYIYSYKNTNGTHVDVQTIPSYSPEKQGAVLPTPVYSDVNDNREFNVEYDATYGWTSTLKVDVDAGNYTFGFDKLTFVRDGITLPYTVTTLDGVAVDANTTIDLTSSGTQEFIINVTDNHYYDATGKLSEESIIHTYRFRLLSTKTSLPAPTWESTELTGTHYMVVDSKNSDWNVAVSVLDGLSVNYWSNTSNSTVTANLADLTIPTGALGDGSNKCTLTKDGEYTITITTSGFKTNDNGKPVGVTVNGTNKLYFTVASSSNYVSTSTTNRTITVNYTFTDANNSEPISLTKSIAVNYSDISGTQYKYSDFCNGTLTKASTSCVTGNTLITLADGTQKRIDAVTTDDMLLVWNHFTGNYEAVPAAIIFNHGFDNNTVIKLNFSDGTQVKMVNLHQFFDADLNKYVSIDATTVADYVGHNFVKQSGDSYTTVTLDSFEISEEYIEAYGIISALHYNILVEGMFSTDFMLEDYDLFNYFAFGEGMMFDAELMQNDIEKYGLYTYEDFADYLTYEQFVAFNVQYFKISVAKGHYTYEGILDLISEYLSK